jgi:hypothetical protein
LRALLPGHAEAATGQKNQKKTNSRIRTSQLPPMPDDESATAAVAA